MLGGFVAALLHLPAAAFVVVGMVAVFGAAARVPIAALVMVAEMTGGYQLLPAATFAVVLSYLLQTRLSANLKYRSLYEAQVLDRADSPALYMENVRTALKILGSGQIPRSVQVGHLDLVSLLDSGVPIKLRGRRELGVGILKLDSALVGKTVQAAYDLVGGSSFEIVAILRDGEIILPNRDTTLRENDRVLTIGSSEARSRISEHLGTLEPVERR